ncbi:O-antigen ligase family protein [Sphingomonas sp. IC-56]|uniref:O-antigen ligase family protein n=1 Tax=Sphingomonas sp. IC-56 TaxID=2898529 RepID=UPI001E48CAEB|nr:O-antigen ligase family protein [Sphingomonas sp. IC-56]
MTFLLLVLVTGGSSREDVQSLVVLLPAAVLCCGVALWGLRAEHLRRYRGLAALLGAILVLVVLHMVPLPPALWHALPGRELVAQQDRLLGFGEVWRPISLVPEGAANVLYGLAVPVAVFLLGIRLSQDRLRQLVPVLLVLGAISGCWAVLQFAGGLDSVFYTYRVSNPDVATGAFANRNHQAVFLALLYPMLGAFAAGPSRDGGVARAKRLGSLALGLFLFPLILGGGSRIGLFAALLGILFGGLLYVTSTARRLRERRKEGGALRRGLIVAAVLLVSAIVIASVTYKGVSFDRLMQASATQELRLKVWPLIWKQSGDYFPVGSGAGSFAPVFQLAEPDQILRPTYLNRAHNEFLEILLTAGLPGMLLLAAGFIMVLNYGRQALMRGRHARVAQCGVAVIILLVLGSITDYPIRTPILSSVLVIASLWAAAVEAEVRGGAKRPDDRSDSAEQ